MVTVAPGMVPPVASFTTPTMLPYRICATAAAGGEARETIEKLAATRMTRLNGRPAGLVTFPPAGLTSGSQNYNGAGATLKLRQAPVKLQVRRSAGRIGRGTRW